MPLEEADPKPIVETDENAMRRIDVLEDMLDIMNER